MGKGEPPASAPRRGAGLGLRAALPPLPEAGGSWTGAGPRSGEAWGGRGDAGSRRGGCVEGCGAMSGFPRRDSGGWRVSVRCVRD